MDNGFYYPGETGRTEVGLKTQITETFWRSFQKRIDSDSHLPTMLPL
jgi:hypothetical protein